MNIPRCDRPHLFTVSKWGNYGKGHGALFTKEGVRAMEFTCQRCLLTVASSEVAR